MKDDLNQNNETYVYINKSVRSFVTKESDPNDKWDGDDLKFEYDIHGYEVVKSKDYMWDFVVDEVPTGDWFLVCVYYSTGDSFHHEDHKLSMASFVKNEEDAHTIAKAIREDYDSYKKSDSFDIKPLQVKLLVANKTEEIYTGQWKGYFEHVEYIEVISIGNLGKRSNRY